MSVRKKTRQPGGGRVVRSLGGAERPGAVAQRPWRVWAMRDSATLRARSILPARVPSM